MTHSRERVGKRERIRWREVGGRQGGNILRGGLEREETTAGETEDRNPSKGIESVNWARR